MLPRTFTWADSVRDYEWNTPRAYTLVPREAEKVRFLVFSRRLSVAFSLKREVIFE